MPPGSPRGEADATPGIQHSRVVIARQCANALNCSFCGSRSRAPPDAALRDAESGRQTFIRGRRRTPDRATAHRAKILRTAPGAAVTGTLLSCRP